MTAKLNILGKRAVDAVIGLVICHLNPNVRPRRAIGLKARVLGGSNHPVGSAHNKLFIQLAGKHIERELPPDAILVLNDDHGMVINIRTLTLALKVQKVNGAPPGRVNPRGQAACNPIE